MSSSSPDKARRRVGRRLCIAILAAGVPLARAADTYVVPSIEASTEYYQNRDLAIAPSPLAQDVPGYVLTLGGTAGVRTPRSSTEFRPMLRLQEFPDRNDLAATNATVDFRSRFDRQLSNWEIRARYLRQDRTNRQLLEAGFDEFDPEQPVVDGVSRVSLRAETLNDIQLRPRYMRRFSPRVDLVLGALYQRVGFDSEGLPVGVDFENAELSAGLRWAISQRTSLASGVYTTRYETTGRLDNLTTSNGVTFDASHNWSERLLGSAQLSVERAESSDASGVVDTTNNVALNFSATSRGIVDQWRMTVGRSFAPTGFGTRNTVDQIRLQYLRSLNVRLRASGAVRFLRSRALGFVGNDNRTYGRLETDLQWALSRTWSVTGVYAFTRQEFERDPDAGVGHMVALRLRYQGLPPQR
jgi:hypothetical protein